MALDRLPDVAELYRDLAPRLWRAVYAYSGGRRTIADDAVAEAFARLIESDGAVRRPFSWLYRVALRIAAAEMRRESARFPDREEVAEPAGLGDLMRAMRQLSPSQRTAVFLHYQADLPVRDVALAMGTSVAAVKVHLHRGRNRLRSLLGTEEADDG
jgi:RNA polymerase sigma-70 factor (ECF subfamily)